MKPLKKSSFFSSTTVTYGYHNDHYIPVPPPNSNTSTDTPTPITVHLPPQPHSSSAIKIQSAFRAHMIRILYRKLAAVNSEANHLQRLIQRQDTVDAIRSSDKEKLKMNEALMGLLLRLDSVPGMDPTIREARRNLSRRIVGLQEILDAIAETYMNYSESCGWRYDCFGKTWDQYIEEMEENICREQGGEEMERFCAEHLGFRCLQRFLREP